MPEHKPIFAALTMRPSERRRGLRRVQDSVQAFGRQRAGPLFESERPNVEPMVKMDVCDPKHGLASIKRVKHQTCIEVDRHRRRPRLQRGFLQFFLVFALQCLRAHGAVPQRQLNARFRAGVLGIGQKQVEFLIDCLVVLDEK
mmetsp:Transcript_12616/g.21166  ORF Transcript_12616/g.21166 Transcript_12616/m.21166 type:complete len:143 (+) Transcript_12616:105-533(+)